MKRQSAPLEAAQTEPEKSSRVYRIQEKREIVNEPKFKTRMDFGGVPVPITISLDENATAGERAAWDTMTKMVIADAPMSFGVRNEPVKREEKSKV